MTEHAAETERERLLQAIENRRRAITAYLRSARPRSTRLTHVAVVSSAVAAALTAPPGLGGPQFASFFVDRDIPAVEVWQPLCLLASVVSIVAAVSANLSLSKTADAQIIQAEVCNAELDGLRMRVDLRQCSIAEAVDSYQQYVLKVAFVDEPGPRPGWRSGLRRRREA